MSNTPATHETPVTPETTVNPDASPSPFQPLSKTDVGRVLGVCVRTIDAWVNSGEMPPPAKIGARVYWHPQQFYSWLDKRLKVVAPPVTTDSAVCDAPNLPEGIVPPRLLAKPRPAPKSSAAERALERSSKHLARLNLE